MIHSVSSYLQRTISSYIQAFCSNSYILRWEVLGDFPSDVKQDFIQTFCTDKDNKGIHIPVRFTFNATKNNPEMTVLIQEESGKELVNQDQSLGYNMGSATPVGNNITREGSTLSYDPKRKMAYFQVSHKPTNVEDINSYSGPTKIIGNRIYLTNHISAIFAKMNDTPETASLIVYRYTTDVPTEKNKKRTYQLEGYDATENYTIDLISQNINLIRCMGALMKVIFITMRLQALHENLKYYIPKITEANVDLLHQLNDDKQSTAYNQLYYKRFTLNYIMTYTIPAKLGIFIKNIVSNPKFNFHIYEKSHPSEDE